MTTLQNRFQFLNSPPFFLGWTFTVVVVGLVSGLDRGWVAFAAILPAALFGFQAVLRPEKVLQAPAESTMNSVLLIEALLARTQQMAHELDREALTLLTVVTEQGGVGQQANILTRASRTLDEFNEMADRARREAVQLAVLSRQTATVTQSGQAALEQAIKSIAHMQTQVNEIVTMLGTLARHVRRVSEINAAISEIATQSNFLALNAAIEAARAGEQGRSFATIADEVRVLSEQSRAAVTQVREVLTQIHKTMEQTVSTTQAGAESVDSGAAMARQARETISQLSANLSQSTGVVQKIIAAIDHQSSGIETLVGSVNGVGQAALQSQAGLRIAETVARDLGRRASELNGLTAEAEMAGIKSGEPANPPIASTVLPTAQGS
jgi:methyl-accepting chemotaxis protein